MAERFRHYELRTTDVDAARAFYTEVFGPELWGSGVSVTRLPERAAAQGAPAHWLGHIGVRDVEAAAGRLVALGGQRLGPARRGSDGSLSAVVRDPFGAVLAVSPETASPPSTAVAFHVLHAPDAEQAFVLYSALFGWTKTKPLEPGARIGAQQTFTWDGDASETSAGCIVNSAELSHIHPHWLFCFRVGELDRCLARARANGGNALEPTHTSNGARVAHCEDPQGAAFALYER